MSKVTSKYQITLPQRIAKSYSIQPGDEIDWVAAGDVIRVIPHGKENSGQDLETRLRIFDQATVRLQSRADKIQPEANIDRGWSRQDLYTRGSTD